MINSFSGLSKFHKNSDRALLEDQQQAMQTPLPEYFPRNIPKDGQRFMMKRPFAVVLLIAVVMSVSLLFISGCSKDDEDDDEDLVGNWIELSDFEGVPRSDAVAFSIGNKAYVGTGWDGEDRLKDFWEYNAQLNNWTRKADFPGAARNGAVAFSTDAKGYVGTGYDGVNKLKDFWEYDPAANTWRQIADFGGTARYGAVAFAVNNKGYVGTGDDGNFLKDFWEYDPVADKWTQKVSLAGAKRRDAVAFVIAGKGYVCTGINNGTYEYDFWEYDPLTEIWNKKNSIADVNDDDFDDDYDGIVGINKVAFSVNGTGYVATGGEGSADATVWEYNPTTDLWTQKTSLEASGRIEAVGFAIGSTAYVTTGRNSSYYFDDLWGFQPGADQQDLDKKMVVNP
jgi:N-acetylneuraminic acid mutarotase